MRSAAKERVFVHDHQWAYCAAGREAPSHQWIPTGGVDRQRIESGIRQRDRI